MIYGTSAEKRNIIGDDYLSMAKDRVAKLRRSLGYLNNGYVFTNYDNKTIQYFTQEISYLLRTLRNERVILWTSQLTKNYQRLYEEYDGVCIDLSETTQIPYDKNLIIITAPRNTDERLASFKSLSRAISGLTRQQAKIRTYLYVDNVDCLFRDESEYNMENAIYQFHDLIRHSRRKNIVITGALTLPLINYPFNYQYDYMINNAAYILIAGEISPYDADDLSRICGESPTKIFNICAYNEMTLLLGTPRI